MGFFNCAVCLRRIPSNKVKARAGAPSRWTRVQNYGRIHGICIQKSDLLCGRCDVNFAARYDETNRLPSFISRIPGSRRLKSVESGNGEAQDEPNNLEAR
jgi:hypothetical protein